jgi:hypothetical protein
MDKQNVFRIRYKISKQHIKHIKYVLKSTPTYEFKFKLHHNFNILNKYIIHLHNYNTRSVAKN